MAKKQKGRVVQMLSPENYIRKKARTLPIHECWINSGWREDGLAHIIVARKHTNGNSTMCIYLVDLKCLGVKDTHYLFNLPEFEYQDHLNMTMGKMEMEQVNYELAHNIVLAGIEFAEDYGFKPHKDYTSVTQYMLEEDTDEIELMEIECGVNDKPFYIRGPLDTDARANQIIAQLEKTAGAGNYSFVDGLETPFDEDVDQSDMDDPYEEMDLDEMLSLFKNYIDRIEALNPSERDELADLTATIIGEQADWDKMDSYYDNFLTKLDEREIVPGVHDEMLGEISGIETSVDQFKSDLNEVFDLLSKNLKKAEKKLNLLSKKIPDNPLVQFLELSLLELKESKRFEPELERYYEKFPEYPLGRVLWAINHPSVEEEEAGLISLHNVLETFFPNRKWLSRIELYYVYLYLLLVSVRTNNLEQVEAIDDLLETTGMDDEKAEGLFPLITMAKVGFILSLSDAGPIESETTFQFKVQIKNITKPPVWRRITVPSGYTFFKFHAVIQVAFGWQNEHMFKFSPDGHRSYPQIKLLFDEDRDEDWGFRHGEILDAEKTKLSGIFTKENQKFTYIYDFGDDWLHTILLEKILLDKSLYPNCLDGKGQCPPEDCGGPWGYTGMKDILADKKHPQYKSYREWLGLKRNEQWDPSAFKLEETRKYLVDIFSQN